MKKILIIYNEERNLYELSWIEEGVRAYDYEYNLPMYDGYQWGIVVAEKKSIEYGVRVLRDKIIETAKHEIDQNIELIKKCDRMIYFKEDLEE